MKNILIIIFVLIFIKANAWHDPSGPGADNSAMAGSGVAMKSFWGINNNQALLAFQKSFGAGFYYENNFMLKQTSYNHIATVIPALGGSFGLNMSYFGYQSFNEKKVGFAYGRKLGDKFAMGVQLDYLHNFIADNYGSKGLLSFEIGIITELNENFTIGAHVFNPFQSKINDYNDERIKTNMSIGLCWKPNDNILINLDAEAESVSKLRIKSGIEYNIKDWFFIRAGVANNPNIFSFGAGFKQNNLKVDISSSMHQILGFSPQISAVYQLGN